MPDDPSAPDARPGDGLPRDVLPRDVLAPDGLPHDQRRARRPAAPDRLTRSRRNRVVAGVLGGVAGYVGANPRLVRLVFAVATILSGGILTVGYLLLWWLLPKEPA